MNSVPSMRPPISGAHSRCVSIKRRNVAISTCSNGSRSSNNRWLSLFSDLEGAMSACMLACGLQIIRLGL